MQSLTNTLLIRCFFEILQSFSNMLNILKQSCENTFVLIRTLQNPYVMSRLEFPYKLLMPNVFVRETFEKHKNSYFIVIYHHYELWRMFRILLFLVKTGLKVLHLYLYGILSIWCSIEWTNTKMRTIWNLFLSISITNDVSDNKKSSLA